MYEEWVNDYQAFASYVREVLGDSPGLGHSLDRVGNDEGYIPGNLRWATSKIQNRNRVGNVLIEYDGRCKCIAEWADEAGLKYMTLYRRLYSWGWSVDKAITTPVTKKGKDETQET